MRVPSEVRKTNESAKVKFLPAEEAINLNSGTKAATQVLHSNLGLPTNPLDPSSAICKRTEVLGKITNSKSFLLTETMNPFALHGMQTCTTLQKQAVKMSDLFAGEEHPPGFPSKQSAIGSAAIAKVAEGRPGKSVAIDARAELGAYWSVLKVKAPRGEKVGSIPSKEPVQEGPDAAAIPSKKVEASSRPESQTSDSVTAPSTYVKPPCIGSSGISFPSGPSSRCVNIQERDLQQIFPFSRTHPLSGPGLKVLWKGSFEILDFSSDNRIYEGFLAHPSAKISCKAYEFARQIAGALQFRIHSRRAFWPEIFQSDCPDVNDIALYFYPGKIERSKRQYAFLLKLIEKQDLMLRSRMGHVELLVFPSKLLHVDSQKLDGSYFMWGVFCSLKDKKVA